MSWRLLYGEVGLVFHGLDKLIGEADVEAGDDPSIMALMLHEHEMRDDSHPWFSPTNYPIVTTSYLEWWIVVDPSLERLKAISERLPQTYAELEGWPMAAVTSRPPRPPPSSSLSHAGGEPHPAALAMLAPSPIQLP